MLLLLLLWHVYQHTGAYTHTHEPCAHACTRAICDTSMCVYTSSLVILTLQPLTSPAWSRRCSLIRFLLPVYHMRPLSISAYMSVWARTRAHTGRVYLPQYIMRHFVHRYREVVFRRSITCFWLCGQGRVVCVCVCVCPSCHYCPESSLSCWFGVLLG